MLINADDIIAMMVMVIQRVPRLWIVVRTAGGKALLCPAATPASAANNSAPAAVRPLRSGGCSPGVSRGDWQYSHQQTPRRSSCPITLQLTGVKGAAVAGKGA